MQERSEKLKNKEAQEKKILELVVKDLANEFVKGLTILDLIDFKKDVNILFSKEDGRYIPEQLWERYKDFSKEIVLDLEKNIQN